MSIVLKPLPPQRAWSYGCILGDARRTRTERLLRDVEHLDGVDGPLGAGPASNMTVLWCRIMTPVGR